MSPHWSGVEFGQYFELTVAYDPELYTEASVQVPFYLNESTGLSICMLEAVDFGAKSIAVPARVHPFLADTEGT